jgi:hypothetical protein
VIEELHCLDEGRSECAGEVEWREPLSATGKPFARCAKHWEERLAEQERINRDYPDSPCPPDWFDPTLAGEVWDED